MRVYETQTVTQTERVMVSVECDICGESESDLPSPLIPVELAINVGEEGSGVWRHDFCDECFALVVAPGLERARYRYRPGGAALLDEATGGGVELLPIDEDEDE